MTSKSNEIRDFLNRNVPYALPARYFFLFLVLPLVVSFFIQRLHSAPHTETYIDVISPLLWTVFVVMMFRFPEFISFDNFLRLVSEQKNIPGRLREYIRLEMKVRRNNVLLCIGNGIIAVLIYVVIWNRIDIADSIVAVVGIVCFVFGSFIHYFANAIHVRICKRFVEAIKVFEVIEKQI